MTSYQENAIAKLRAQQNKADADSPERLVAEQLIDIVRREPSAAELLSADLDNPDMDIIRAAMKIKAVADDKHKKSGKPCVCVTPAEAEAALRQFYGLPAAPAVPAAPPVSDAQTVPAAPAVTGSFADFL